VIYQGQRERLVQNLSRLLTSLWCGGRGSD